MKYLLLVLIFSLQACAQTSVAPSSKTVIPQPLLRDCPVTEPPQTQNYMQQEIFKREQLLAEYSLGLLLSLKNCNDQIRSIRSYVDKDKTN